MPKATIPHRHPNEDPTIIKKFLKKLLPKKGTQQQEPLIIPREQHNISRQNISPNALKVLYHLHKAGFSAYLVGGSVRDLLLGHAPKDFDVATDARPEQIKELFRNCILIGRRFRLAHIRFGREIVEVATFRGSESNKARQHRHTAEHGMLLRDNVYGTLEEDACRRDFTINALYYNIADHTVVDYCNGIHDLKHRTLRIIGEPIKRYQEDPVRLLRTIRFAGKLGFHIEPKTEAPIKELATLLQHVPAARLFDETLKLFHGKKAFETLQLLQKYHLFEQLFPQTAACLQNPTTEKILKIACQNTDARLSEGKTVSPAFLFATLLWPPTQALTQKLLAGKVSPGIARDQAVHKVIANQHKCITIPRRYTLAIREIWHLQNQLVRRRSDSISRMLNHPRFRAAYDFLLLRAQAGEVKQEIADWWTDFSIANETAQKQLIAALPRPTQRRHRKPKTKPHPHH